VLPSHLKGCFFAPADFLKNYPVVLWDTERAVQFVAGRW